MYYSLQDTQTYEYGHGESCTQSFDYNHGGDQYNYQQVCQIAYILHCSQLILFKKINFINTYANSCIYYRGMPLLCYNDMIIPRKDLFLGRMWILNQVIDD